MPRRYAQRLGCDAETGSPKSVDLSPAIHFVKCTIEKVVNVDIGQVWKRLQDCICSIQNPIIICIRKNNPSTFPLLDGPGGAILSHGDKSSPLDCF